LPAQRANGGYGITSLPEKMAGIEVAANVGADLGAELQQSFGIVDDEARVHLQGDSYAVIFANLMYFVQKGKTFSSHCHFNISV